MFEIKDNFCLCLSPQQRTQIKWIRLKQCLPREVFKRTWRWESVSRQPTKTTFQRSFGKEGTCFHLQKAQQQRDILCLQYKNPRAVTAYPKQLPRIRAYRWELYGWADKDPSAYCQFVLVKKVMSDRYTLFCTDTEHLLSYEVPPCLVHCSGPWHAAFSYPLNVFYKFLFTL